MDQMTEERVTRVMEAVVQALTPNAAEIRAALVAVVNFNPADQLAQFRLPPANPYGADYARRKDVKTELQLDSKQPFFCESYLYNLLGKEDARTLLGRMDKLCQALGIADLHSLYPQDEEGGEGKG